MGTYIMKPDRDVDGYVAWSTVVDGPVAWGSEKQVADFLQQPEGDLAALPERFRRADTTGRSLVDSTDDWTTLLVLNGGRSRGLLARERVWEWLEAGMPDEMLEPLDDQ